MEDQPQDRSPYSDWQAGLLAHDTEVEPRVSEGRPGTALTVAPVPDHVGRRPRLSDNENELVDEEPEAAEHR
jgi:hypothetical protein